MTTAEEGCAHRITCLAVWCCRCACHRSGKGLCSLQQPALLAHCAVGHPVDPPHHTGCQSLPHQVRNSEFMNATRSTTVAYISLASAASLPRLCAFGYVMYIQAALTAFVVLRNLIVARSHLVPAQMAGYCRHIRCVTPPCNSHAAGMSSTCNATSNNDCASIVGSTTSSCMPSMSGKRATSSGMSAAALCTRQCPPWQAWWPACLVSAAALSRQIPLLLPLPSSLHALLVVPDARSSPKKTPSPPHRNQICMYTQPSAFAWCQSCLLCTAFHQSLQNATTADLGSVGCLDGSSQVVLKIHQLKLTSGLVVCCLANTARAAA